MYSYNRYKYVDTTQLILELVELIRWEVRFNTVNDTLFSDTAAKNVENILEVLQERIDPDIEELDLVEYFRSSIKNS